MQGSETSQKCLSILGKVRDLEDVERLRVSPLQGFPDLLVGGVILAILPA